MESRLSSSARQQLDRFCRQYFQLQLQLDYPDEAHLRNDAFQQSLYGRLFEDYTMSHAPPQRFQLRVLKELTKRIEQSIQDWEEEVCTFLSYHDGISLRSSHFQHFLTLFLFQGISDDLMSSLSSLFSSRVPSEGDSAQQKSFVTYTISSLPSNSEGIPTITLHEARNIVAAAGTTGLRTWEAALHMGNYLCAHATDLVHGKSILELGAGTGYLSILCSKHLGASHILATDGSDDVVSDFSTNFYLNGLQDSSLIEGKELKWGQALLGSEHPQWNLGRQIDLVLGADVTYDRSSIPALVSTFGELFDLYPSVKIIIAAAVRTPTTLQGFLETCRGNRYVVEEIEFGIPKEEMQQGPFYSDKIPIQLCLIRKS